MRALAVIGLILSMLSVKGGEAVFAEDGKTVYAVNDSALDLIHTDTGEITSVHPPDVGDIDGICRAGSGSFYLVSKNALWRWKPGDESSALIEKAVEGRTFDDVASSDDDKQVLIVGSVATRDDESECRLFYRSAPDHDLVAVRRRHLESATILAPEFLPDGTVLFSAEGDLWHGEFEEEVAQNEDGTRGKTFGTLTAYRYAPLATRYAYPGTPSEEGVQGIASGAGRVFVHIARIGGSGWGHLASLLQPQPVKNGNLQTHNKVEDSIKVLQSVRKLSENGSTAFLCASPDRKLVYMTDSNGPDRTHFLADEAYQHGTPVAFRIGSKILIHK